MSAPLYRQIAQAAMGMIIPMAAWRRESHQPIVATRAACFPSASPFAWSPPISDSDMRVLERTDRVWPHHLVVFVLEDVTVPDVLASTIETCLDPDDFARIANHRVLRAAL